MWYDEFVRQFHDTFIQDDMYKLFLTGMKNTLLITMLATLVGCILGVLVALLKVYHFQTKRVKWLDVICNIYLTVIRGTPVTVQLLIMYFIVFTGVDNAIIIAVFTFGINSGAYVAEIVRAGILAIDIGQTEAGRSLGLSTAKTMRLIVLPQAIKNILPALGNEFIALLKETSVVGYITVVDFTRAGNLVRAKTSQAFFSLIFVALGYLLIVIFITYLLKRLEGRLKKSDRS